MTTKHTPGPRFIVVGSVVIENTEHGRRAVEPDRCVRALNAEREILPELLEALTMMLEQHGSAKRKWVDDGPPECPCIGCFHARAAIAKATGKES